MKKLNMMMLMMLCLLSLMLTACSHIIKNRDHEYLRSTALPALQTPQGVSHAKLGEDYPVSGNIYANSKAPSLVPPGSLAASQGQK